ncbi:hypothetical protein UA08_06805 [Talaromyces atroroseus]|uniref:Hydrophobin n=1 Tax=Talaromyces atroroseus TaxID=1441469 RepID=A0A225ACB9_TALAT|nr:hypothetical protein UA08_06805 [Talaromyces atroroseus]OKL58010.1 hypothetical protein UA08_06805 [Talaromyces atroroseus]
MRATILALLSFAMAVTAAVGPQGSQEGLGDNPPIADAQKEYPDSDIACCQNKEILSADGILGNLLGKGALNNVLGVGDSACAKFSLIENLNILGITKEDGDGVKCIGSTAYCPHGEADCKLIGH